MTLEELVGCAPAKVRVTIDRDERVGAALSLLAAEFYDRVPEPPKPGSRSHQPVVLLRKEPSALFHTRFEGEAGQSPAVTIQDYEALLEVAQKLSSYFQAQAAVSGENWGFLTMAREGLVELCTEQNPETNVLEDLQFLLRHTPGPSRQVSASVPSLAAS